MKASPLVQIGVPVWHGADWIEETLQSIAAQTWTRWRACISVDDGDLVSAARCRRFLEDPRFELVVQPTRLGWAGNLNWLMARAVAQAEYFVYWQQDDLCTANYLEVLVDHMSRHPEAVCGYADVEWFGGRSGRVRTPSVTGFALERVLDQIETMSFLPFRGLIRRSALVAAGPIGLESEEAALADLVWNVRLARAGELHAVEGTTYHKRAHQSSAHASWLGWPPARRRAAWVNCAMGMMAAALPVVTPEDRPRLLAILIERFTLARSGRALVYDPAEDGPAAVAPFAAALADEALRRFGVSRPTAADGGPTGAHRLLAEADRRDDVLREIAERLVAGDTVAFGAGGAGVALLGPGWSMPESWGTWSASATARLEVPPLGEGAWRIRMNGHAIRAPGAGDDCRIEIDIGSRRQLALTGKIGTISMLEFDTAAGDAAHGLVLTFSFPDAIVPAMAGLGPDPRLLGFGLRDLAATRL